MSAATVSGCGDVGDADPIDDLLNAFVGDDPVLDTRPELHVATSSTVDPFTRPPTIIVRLIVHGRPDHIYRFQRRRTASEATLLILIHVVRELDGPTRLRLTTDDPTVAKLLDWSPAVPPPWLRRVADVLEYEAAIIDTTVSVKHLDLADDIAPEPLGHG